MIYAWIFLRDIAILTFIAGAAWWLTGFGTTLTGQSARDHYVMRGLRCVLVLFFSIVILIVATAMPMGLGSLRLIMIAAAGIGWVLRSAISELSSRFFILLLDPGLKDAHRVDSKKTHRYRDAIAYLIHHGHRDEAIKLCEELKQSGEVDLITLENTLEYLGVKQTPPPSKRGGTGVPPDSVVARPTVQHPRLEPAHALRPRGTGLPPLLPPVASGVAPDSTRTEIHQTSKAGEPGCPEPPAEEPFELAAVDALLAQGSLGLAVEKLEHQAVVRPDDFDVQLKLAEVYAVRLDNLIRAERIVRRLEHGAKFQPEQIALAQSKLKEWWALVESNRR